PFEIGVVLFGLHQLLAARLFLDQLLVYRLDLRVEALTPCFLFKAALARGITVSIPAIHAEQLREDLLTFARRLRRELVGAPLQEKAGVDEGVVVHAQELLDGGLCGAHARLAEAAPVAVSRTDLQLQRAIASRLLLADDAIGGALQRNLQKDFGLLPLAPGAPVDNVVVALAAALAEKRPGDGVEQARLSGAVVPGDTGQVQAVKIQHRRLAVREEVG